MRLRAAAAVLALVAAVITVWGGQPADAQESPQPQVRFAVATGSGIGGDYARLARVVRALKDAGGDRAIGASLGSLLGPTPLVREDRGISFLHSARQGGIEFIVPGPGEFLYGVEALGITSEYMDVPTYVAVNIILSTTHRPLVSPYAVRTVGGTRILFIGIADPELIKNTPDELIRGIDMAPPVEAIVALESAVRAESPDMVIAAGPISRDLVRELAAAAPFIDVIITNRKDAGFSGERRVVTTAEIGGVTVYVAPEGPDMLGLLRVSDEAGTLAREFTEVAIPPDAPADDTIMAELGSIVETIQRRENEEAQIVKTGAAVTGILRSEYDVDAVFIERPALYYYPVSDTLTVLDTDKIVRPSQYLTRITLKGGAVRNIWTRSRDAADPSFRLHTAGITAKAEIDSLPIEDNRIYEVLTTQFLLGGGLGYGEFSQAEDIRIVSRTLNGAVERAIVARDERLRAAERVKLWKLKLHFQVGINFTRSDVDKDKASYRNDVPKPFRDYGDQFTSVLKLSSWNNEYNYDVGRHSTYVRLHMKYDRSGFRPQNGKTEYAEAGDEIRLYSKYTYNHAGFVLKPYVDNDTKTEFYYPRGKHPIFSQVSAGVTRKFVSFVDMTFNVGFSASRDYFQNVNAMGYQMKANFDKSYPANKVLTRATEVHSELQMNYRPTMPYGTEFTFQGLNNITLQLMNRLNLILHVNTYAYRNSKLRRMAIGLFYDLTLNYGMDWNL